VARRRPFAVGAVLAGALADAYSITAAIVAVATITAASDIHVAVRMRETSNPHAPTDKAPARHQALRDARAG
jgi:hypothetical protein